MGRPRSSVAPDLVGREVSTRAITTIWEILRGMKRDPTPLAVGTGLSVDELTNPRGRVSWAAFHRFMSNLGTLVDDEMLVEIGRTALDSPFLRALLLPGRYLMGVGDVYRWCFGPQGPSRSLFAVNDVEISEVTRDQVRFEILLIPGYAPSRENFFVLKGSLIALGTALTGKAARVEFREVPGGAVFDIHLPPRQRAFDRIRALVASGGATNAHQLERAHRELYTRYAELEREVEARMKIEARLRTSEERYRALFEGGPLPAWVFDLETLRFLAVNSAATHHYGFSREEFLAMSIKDIRPAEDVPLLLGELERGLVDAPSTWRHRKRDGSIILVELTMRNLDIEGRPARLVVVNDVTARVQLERQLRDAQQTEAVGHLAGGIAHDFNNLLTVIISSTELQLRQAELPASTRRDLETTLAAATRGAELVHQLLAFSKQRLATRGVVDVTEVLRGMHDLLVRTVGGDVRLSLQTSRSVGTVCIDRASVERIIMNLAANARDAMPGGGTLSLETCSVLLDENGAGAVGVAPGDYAVVVATDTGIGMDAETKARIFEPYFTTKPTGKGSGLGLASVRAIVERAHGFVRVETSPASGSRFEVFLPVSRGGVSLRYSPAQGADESVSER